MSKDHLYRDRESACGSFEFDESVAAVFPDMLQRSIPGYQTTIEAIGSLARQRVVTGSRCYDLGCSLGAATLAMRRNITADGVEIHAIDHSPAMTERCQASIDADDGKVPVHVSTGDIREAGISNASMVVMNYTLQFLPLDDRDAMIRRISDGLRPDGALVLSEKIAHEDPAVDALLIELHHEFKRTNDYSALEIARKRTALENVLVPETVSTHLDRLTRSGFSSAAVWLQHFNFVSIIAVK